MNVKPLVFSACLLLGNALRGAPPVWKVETARFGHQVRHLDVANDGSVLATFYPQSKRVVLLEGRSGKVLWRRSTRRGSAGSLTLSADGKTAGYMDLEPDDYDFRGTLYLLDRRGKVHLTRYTRGPAALSPRGDRIAIHSVAGDSGWHWGLKMLDRRGRTLWHRPDGVEMIELTPNGKYVLTGGSDTCVWSMNGKCVWRLATGRYVPVASDTGRTVAAMDGATTLFIVDRGRRGTKEHIVTANYWANGGRNPAVTRDGALVGAVQVAHTKFGDRVGPAYYLLRAFTPNGVNRWSAALPPFPGDTIFVHPLGQDGLVVVAYSPDGAMACYAVNHLGKVRTCFELYPKSTHGVPWALSPDGRKLALADGSELRLYSLAAP